MADPPPLPLEAPEPEPCLSLAEQGRRSTKEMDRLFRNWVNPRAPTPFPVPVAMQRNEETMERIPPDRGDTPGIRAPPQADGTARGIAHGA